MLRSIGIDFDNTIVDYTDVFARSAYDLGLLPLGFKGDKTLVRDTIRALPGGNWKWTQLQAQVYGRDIVRAVPFAGFDTFLRRSVAAGVPLFIISHKGRYAAADADGIDLHEAALGWLRAQGFLGVNGPLSRGSIFFEGERSAKIERISTCGCTDFVDDLDDIFRDPLFPANVRGFHFGDSRDRCPRGVRSWWTISDAMFGE